MRRLRKITSVLLLVLYATFFASTNLFVHSHDIFGQHIVHSHLGGSAHHSHSADQLQTINILGTESFIFSETFLDVLKPFPSPTDCITVHDCPAVLQSESRSHCLRAPPYVA